MIRPLQLIPAAILALLASAGWAVEAASPDLLRNGGFEEWGAGGPVGWSAWDKNSATTQVVPAASAAAGRRAVRFGDRDPAKGAVLRQGPVEGLVAGGVYELTFLARSDLPDQGLTVIAYSDPHAGQHWYRPTELRLDAAWRRYRVAIRLPDAASFRPVAIHLWLARGRVEIDEAALRPAAAAAGEALAPRVNRLDDPGFDLGGRSWRYFPWYQAVEALPSFDEQVRHGGRRSIRFPGQGESLESRIYALPTGQTVTLSAWVRGDPAAARGGTGFNMFLITPAWKLQSLEVPAARLGADWRRFSLRMRLPPHDDPYGASVYVRFDAHTALWLDSLQLEAGDQPTAYQPGAQIGIESELPDLVAAPGAARLMLRAEQPASAAATAQVSVHDARGRELWSTSVDLGAPGPDGVARPLEVPLTRLGVAEVRADLRGADGARLAGAALRLAVMDPARPVPPNPLVGIDNHPLQHLAPRVRDRERWATLLGSGCTRVFFSCTNGTRKAWEEDGPAFLAAATALLSPEMQQHRPVTACIEPAHDSPLNLRRMQRDGHGPAAADEPAAIAAYAAKAGKIAAAMGAAIGCYEVLNEPNIWYVSGVAMMPAERLARVIAGVAPAIRAAAPGARVAANINGIDLPYVEALLAAPGAAAIDALTVHPYRSTPELPPLYEDLRRLRALVERLRPGLPIVATEQYYLSREDGFSNGEYDRNYCSQREGDQAGRSLQAALHHLAAEGSPYVFFQPEDNLYRQAPQGVHWFFAATMLRQLSLRLAGLESGVALEAHPAVRAFGFRLRGGARVVTVTARDFGVQGRLVLPAGCTASDCDGNPLAGPEAAVDHLPLWLDFPAGTADAAIAEALRLADWRGLDFPLAVQAADAGGSLAVTVANRGTRPAGGVLEVLAAPPGWPCGRLAIPVLAPGATHAASLPGLPGPLAWDAEASLRWRLSSDGEVAVRDARVPTMRIPRLTPAWPDSAWIALGEDHLSRDFADGKRPHRGPADLAARVALGWQPGGLRFAAEITDDAPFRGTLPDDLLWQVDSLQLYLDPADAAQEGRHGFSRGDACWLFGEALAGGTAAILTHNPGNRYLGAANAEIGPDPALAAAWTRTPRGWTLDVRLPESVLPGLRLRPGALLGWSVLVNDNDGEGRKQGLTLGRAGSEPYERPWLWRCAVLAE
ncbi:MAG: hypothetical protein L6R48_22530 [Planctomycetes bacterium]|nr:hypothetical protein [Planctomycetota bacterium]